ncbi:DNA-binding response regulator, partial [Streptomyces sp. UNOC14_S4]|nr:DNA-binding response regulator [Streptomyces sp. UNOC14_S4]
MIRVLLVHDIHLLRAALAALIAREPDLEVSATPWTRAATMSRAVLPDVCVVDMDSPEAGGPDGLRRLTGRAPAGPADRTGAGPGITAGFGTSGGIGIGTGIGT